MSTPTNTAGRAGPVKKADPDEVQRLHGEGHGRNYIARALGVSRRQVDTAAKALGLEWDRSQTIQATRAALADSQSELASILTGVAATAAMRLQRELDADVLDTQAVRALAVAAGVSIDKLERLAGRVGIESTDPGTAAIKIFSTSLDRAYAELMEQENTTTSEETR